MTKYKTSKDYQKLYEMVKGGFEAVGWVDHKWSDETIVRDIAKVRVRGLEIPFSVRGHQYGGVEGWDKDKESRFLSECQRLNLEWIEP